MRPSQTIILKLAAKIFALLFLGFFSLNLFGKIFIEKMTQDLFIGEEGVQQGMPLAVHEPAPYFELPNFGGKIVSITDFKNIPVMLVFWNTWNDVSDGQMKIIDGISSKYFSTFKTLAVNSQEESAVVSNYIKRGLYTKTEVLLDTNGGVSDIYEARNVPAFYFFDKGGILVSKYYGFLNEAQIIEAMSKLGD